jgi:hypothetical protein
VTVEPENPPTQLSSATLPELLRPAFWDHDFDRLRWDEHCDFIAGRVLASGTWDQVRWLRVRLGDGGLRDWLLRHRGRGLDLRRLRFWQLILDLPAEEVDQWIAARAADPWEARTGR